ncbi:protein PBDC1-like [Diadema antillarum]|uniref:protein PBDC1-like n=1 Tax=Diadema antillarum TaxID=105358 RepID=UPI003A8A580A
MAGDNYGNNEEVEMAWAMQAYHHAETYFNLVSSVDSRQLRLTKHDDELYKHFRHDFPDMNIEVLQVDELKSDTAKRKWRPFCNHFDGTIKDFNFGTLLRLDCKSGYTEENTVFVTRVQFFAVEVARNREGLNLAVWKVHKHKDKADTTGEVKAPKAEEKVAGSEEAGVNDAVATS